MKPLSLSGVENTKGLSSSQIRQRLSDFRVHLPQSVVIHFEYDYIRNTSLIPNKMKKMLVMVAFTLGLATAAMAQTATKEVAQEPVKKECSKADGTKSCCKSKTATADASSAKASCDKSAHASTTGEVKACCKKDGAAGEKAACTKTADAGEAKACCKKDGDKKECSKSKTDATK